MKEFLRSLKTSEPPDPGKVQASYQDIDMDEVTNTTNSPNTATVGKKVRTQSASTDVSLASVPMYNSYSELEDDVDGPQASTDGGTRKRKRRKVESQNKNHQVNPNNVNDAKREPLPPPITVKNVNIEKLNDSLADIKISMDSLTMKLTQFGIKLYVDNCSNFQSLKDYLIERKIEFFTHQLKQERLSKFVLYGLPRYDVADIKEELKSKKLLPVEVKTLSIKASRYDSHTNYIVYFKKSDQIKIGQLREIKSLFRVIVHWNHYSHKRNDITQCSNCQGFGHGTQNCFLDPICVKCAGSHASKNCPLDAERDENGKIPDKKLYCVHCTHHHTANYHACTKRREYISKQKSLGKPSTRKTFVNAPQLNNVNFPKIPSIPSYQNSQVPAWTNQQSSQNSPAFHKSNSNELFTPKECFQIFNEFLSKMSSCKSRQDQLQVIGEITFKYLK